MAQKRIEYIDALRGFAIWKDGNRTSSIKKS